MAQREALLVKHNMLRADRDASDMTMMTWNADVAARAQTHADGCSMSHSSYFERDGDGENIAMSAASNFVLTDYTDLTDSVQSWYDEVSSAGPYQDGGVFSGFDHCTALPCAAYTQVVWAAANELGC